MENNTEKQTEVQEVEFNYAELTIEDLVNSLTKHGKVSSEEGKKFISLWDSLVANDKINAAVVAKLMILGLSSDRKGIDPIYAIFCYSYIIGFVAGIEYSKNKYK